MGYSENVERNLKEETHARKNGSINYTDQAERLGLYKPSQEDDKTGPTQAVKAEFITPLDPVVVTADGGRLPVIPVEEAVKLNRLKDRTERQRLSNGSIDAGPCGSDGIESSKGINSSVSRQSDAAEAPLRNAIPPSR